MQENIKFIFNSPEESPGYLLAQLNLLWQRKQKKALDPLDITHTQFVLLTSIAWLSNRSVNVMQVEIADFNNFDRMMVSKVLRTLESKKLINRQEHTTDTRAKIVKITSNGKAILQSALTQVEKADIEFFSSIGSDIIPFNSSMLKLVSANKEE